MSENRRPRSYGPASATHAEDARRSGIRPTLNGIISGRFWRLSRRPSVPIHGCSGISSRKRPSPISCEAPCSPCTRRRTPTRSSIPKLIGYRLRRWRGRVVGFHDDKDSHLGRDHDPDVRRHCPCCGSRPPCRRWEGRQDGRVTTLAGPYDTVATKGYEEQGCSGRVCLCLSISITGGPISRYVEPLWTIDHAARYLRCSPRIVLRYARRAGLPYVRLRSGVRLIPSEVRRWAEARKGAR